MAIFLIDSAAKLDYGHDWSDWLAVGDTIIASTWTVTPTGPVLTDSSFDGTSTTVWVDNLTLDIIYTLTNHITTIDGREDDRSIVLRCQNR